SPPFSLSLLPPPPSSTLFPYTTLFRSDLFACTFLFVCQSPSNSPSHLNLENHISLNYQTSFTCDTFNMPKFFSMLIYQRLTIITHSVTTLVCLYEILLNAGCINSVCCFIRR